MAVELLGVDAIGRIARHEIGDHTTPAEPWFSQTEPLVSAAALHRVAIACGGLAAERTVIGDQAVAPLDVSQASAAIGELLTGGGLYGVPPLDPARFAGILSERARQRLWGLVEEFAADACALAAHIVEERRVDLMHLATRIDRRAILSAEVMRQALSATRLSDHRSRGTRQ